MDEPRLRDSWAGRVLGWAGWTVLLVPVTILAHELGHLLVALLLGFPEPVLHFSHISHGDVSGRPRSQTGLVGMAGPLVTAGFILFAILRDRRRGPARWIFALAVAAASRFFVGVPYTLAVPSPLLAGCGSNRRNSTNIRRAKRWACPAI